jgi:nicotinate phosphoribosyltransferase
MSALLTDLYQLTMFQAYLDAGMQEEATFELFVRRLPPQRGFLVAAGLDDALGCLESLHFSSQELDWLQEHAGLPVRTLDALARFRFSGSVHAMAEGTVCFADEPLLRVTAPLPQAQLVESRLLNLVHFQTLVASKAARVVLAAGGRRLIDFGMRRAHGAQAALLAARAAWLAGFDGTATALAGLRWGIPVSGTMAHSFVQAHDDEARAFETFARARPQAATLLIDTYDTEAAAERVARLAPRLAAEGVTIAAVRLDSGDLAAHARAVRATLDAAGLQTVRIVASGNLDEWRVAALVRAGAPIDAFGVGTALSTSSDAPALDAVYKLQHYAGRARRKRSEGKATWPGIKQVWRRFDDRGRMAGDRVGLVDEPADGGVPLLDPVMRDGRRLGAPVPLARSRRHAAWQLACLPDALRALEPVTLTYPVRISARLRDLATAVDRGQPAG